MQLQARLQKASERCGKQHERLELENDLIAAFVVRTATVPVVQILMNATSELVGRLRLSSSNQC